MEKISLKSYAKINLSLDVLGLLENGYHEVSMVMQELQLADDVLVRWYDGSEAETAGPLRESEPVADARGKSAAESEATADRPCGRAEKCEAFKEESDDSRDCSTACKDFTIDIEVSTNRKYLPTDERNIAYKAARLMIEEYGQYAWGSVAGSTEISCGLAEAGGCGYTAFAGDKNAGFAEEELATAGNTGLSNSLAEVAGNTVAARRGKIRIDIKKVIPVAAGLAGGSGNAAAVLCALDRLWKLGLSLDRLCELGAKLGADVPFCVLGLVYGNRLRTPAGGHPLPPALDTTPGRPGKPASPALDTTSGRPGKPTPPALDTTPGRPGKPASPALDTTSGRPGKPTPPALDTTSGRPGKPASPAPDTPCGPYQLYPTSCALAYGTGTELRPLTPLNAWIVLSKPPVSASTAEIYKAFDSLTVEEIGKRPQNESLMAALERKKVRGIEKNMANVLEKAAVKRYPLIIETKKAMKAAAGRAAVMMSGSGPTVFAVLYSKSEALRVYAKMKKLNRETYLTHTLITGRNVKNSRSQTGCPQTGRP